MLKIKLFTLDIIKSILIGIFSGSLLGIIFILIGLICHKGILLDSLYVGRAALLITGSLGLLFSSMFFLKRNGLAKLKNEKSWKNHFKVLNHGFVLLIIFSGIIMIGCILDSVIYSYSLI